jgi:hypothetical protein
MEDFQLDWEAHHRQLSQRSKPPLVESRRLQAVQNRHQLHSAVDYHLPDHVLQGKNAVQIDVCWVEGPPRPPHKRHLQDVARVFPVAKYMLG